MAFLEGILARMDAQPTRVRCHSQKKVVLPPPPVPDPGSEMVYGDCYMGDHIANPHEQESERDSKPLRVLRKCFPERSDSMPKMWQLRKIKRDLQAANAEHIMSANIAWEHINGGRKHRPLTLVYVRSVVNEYIAVAQTNRGANNCIIKPMRIKRMAQDCIQEHAPADHSEDGFIRTCIAAARSAVREQRFAREWLVKAEYPLYNQAIRAVVNSVTQRAKQCMARRMQEDPESIVRKALQEYADTHNLEIYTLL